MKMSLREIVAADLKRWQQAIGRVDERRKDAEFLERLRGKVRDRWSPKLPTTKVDMGPAIGVVEVTLPVLPLIRKLPFGAPSFPPTLCEHCGSVEGVEWEESRTQYEWDGKGENPNRCRALCYECAKEHHAHWDDMWKEYYGGVLP
jgi:hypothetical protein